MLVKRLLNLVCDVILKFVSGKDLWEVRFEVFYYDVTFARVSSRASIVEPLPVAFV